MSNALENSADDLPEDSGFVSGHRFSDAASVAKRAGGATGVPSAGSGQALARLEGVTERAETPVAPKTAPLGAGVAADG